MHLLGWLMNEGSSSIVGAGEIESGAHIKLHCTCHNGIPHCFGDRSDVLIKAMESYWEVLSSPEHSWSSLLDAELESCLCQWAEEESATTNTGDR